MLGQLWQAVQGEFEVSLSRGNFMTWIKPASLIAIEDGVATVHVPTVFIRSWIEAHYRADILFAIQKHVPGISDVVFTVDTADELRSLPSAQPTEPLPSSTTDRPPIYSVETNDEDSVRISVAHMTGQNDTETDYNTNVSRSPVDNSPTIVRKQTFSTYVEGSNNRLAFNACQAVAREPGTRYNPLFIYGGVGLGKTHLMHAVANEILAQPGKSKAIYVSSETFTNDYIDGIRTRKMDAFKKMYRTVDVLLIDDIQFMANKEGSQEEFFNTFNTLHQSNRQIILAADRPPTAIPGLEERLTSRFGWGMVVDIQSPNLETRMAIVGRKSFEKGLTLPDNVMEYIASQAQNNIRELEGALNRVIGYCDIQRMPISLEAAKGALSGMYQPASRRGISSEIIIETVSQHFGITVAEIIGKKRQQNLVYPRHMCMYVLRDQLGLSYPDIGKQMGGKDHTTVMHAVNKITAERSQAHVSQDLDAIRHKIN